jgi:trehalose 6-phosphate synthase
VPRRGARRQRPAGRNTCSASASIASTTPRASLERFRAIERLLELKPAWIGRFSFVQIAAPTVPASANTSTTRPRCGRWRRASTSASGAPRLPPIILKIEHHEPQEVYEYYRGGRPVLRQQPARRHEPGGQGIRRARDDERGVLILSQFTGAARELPEALIVNPYDADQCAAALHLALTMPAGEQRDRMRLMRGLVSEFNVYRWAGRMLLDAAGMRRRGALLEKPSALARRASPR